MEKNRVFDRHYLQQGLLTEIKNMWNQAGDGTPDIIMQQDEGEKEKNEKRIAFHMEQIREKLGSFPKSFWAVHKRKKWKQDIEKIFDEIIWREPLLKMEEAMSRVHFEAFCLETKEFMRNVRVFDKTLEMEDMGQALRNYMVYAIFLELNGMEQRFKHSIFGYSMLYPYTDNYIDEPCRPEAEKAHYNQVIADKLKGVKPDISVLHEKKTVELLADIEKDYSRQDEIYEGLLYMLEAQRDSLKQTDNSRHLSEEEVLNISIYKGGLSVLIDRYFIDKPLNEKDMRFYYGFGFLLQMCDDLQDITRDREEGSRTIFSLCVSKEEMVRKVNRLLNYTKLLFELCDNAREEFRHFLFHNCCLLILFSAIGSSEYMTKEWISWAERGLPVSKEYAEGIRKGFTVNGSEREDKQNKDFSRMLDILLAY